MTNHNPNITSSAATGSFSEDANTTGSTVDHVLTGTMNFTDSDHSDTHTTTTALKTASWSGGSTLPSGALTKFQAGLTSSIVSDSNGVGKLKWTFSEDDRDFDFLAKNETLVLTYEITLKDNHGGSTKKTVTLTVTGTDDRPVFATTTGATLSEQANKSLSFSSDTAHVALQFTDVDLNNTGHTASVLSVSATGNTSGILPGAYGTAELMSFFDINNVVKNAGSSNGVVNTTFSAPDLAFDYLAAGEQIQITYVVQVDDKKGGLSTQNVVVKVNGTNDKPVVLAFPESEHLTEGEDLSGGNLVASGDFHFGDLDLSDTHTVSTTVTSATRSGGGTVPISNDDLIDAFGALDRSRLDGPIARRSRLEFRLAEQRGRFPCQGRDPDDQVSGDRDGFVGRVGHPGNLHHGARHQRRSGCHQDRYGRGRHRRRRGRSHLLHHHVREHRQHGADRRHGQRSVGERPRSGAQRRIQYRRHQPGQPAQRRRNLAIHRHTYGDAAGNRRQRKQRRRHHFQHRYG